MAPGTKVLQAAVHPAVRVMRLMFAVGTAVSPRMSSALAYKLMFRPARARLRDEEAAVLAAAACDQAILCRGKAITTYTWGQGPRVLLVHGWDSCAGHFAGFVAPLLAAGYSVIGFDASGHGRSEGSETDFLEYVQVLGSLQQRCGAFAGVIAHSFGAMCLAYALKHGLQAQRVVLISAPCRFEGLKYKIQSLLGVPDSVIEDLSRRVEHRFADHADVWNEFSADHNARALDLPALIIHDRGDREVADLEGRSIAAAWSGARLLLTEGLGHRRILRDQAVISAAVAFMRGVGASE